MVPKIQGATLTPCPRVGSGVKAAPRTSAYAARHLQARGPPCAKTYGWYASPQAHFLPFSFFLRLFAALLPAIFSRAGPDSFAAILGGGVDGAAVCTPVSTTFTMSTSIDLAVLTWISS